MTQPSPLLLLGLDGNVTTYLLLGLGPAGAPVVVPADAYFEAVQASQPWLDACETIEG